MKQQYEFVVVDDHPLFRQGLVSVIENIRSYHVIGEASTISEALQAIEARQPHVLLVDIALHQENGLELVKTVKSLYPDILQVVVSMYDEVIYASTALKSGAKGYVMKQEAAETLLEAIETVIQGKIYVSMAMHERMLDSIFANKTKVESDPVVLLSVREQEVFRLIGQGFGISEIAEALHLSFKTINVYRDNIRRKLSIGDAGGLRKFAIKWMKSKEM
ncbi:MAG: response regulator transcription factor [Sphaerochaetaceae bacterium]|jgi:DNA-binding NarL/FixJ family response regulator|nr:response regulator transcription factor [Sphaerochaetaceae bacterium]NLO60401.1 response regulator transcription factor [Spirochaetales bacterium]MDD2406246.1 response regulator transcription factor [Sphaerochaetaceae bacterium]MDD4259729.1 response regulator transcription factor [Sphaerochaetaceae bacterium]MDD4842557.1 response regulator transcription factor [Sphaerochaetaceae bacterium]